MYARSRAIETMVITSAWKHSAGHPENNHDGLRPKIIVKEHWRENIGAAPNFFTYFDFCLLLLLLVVFISRRLFTGLHTCDQRRSKHDISTDFPMVEFEDGFSEQDLLWTKDEQVYAIFSPTGKRHFFLESYIDQEITRSPIVNSGLHVCAWT
jgi:hypothetical protein